ncbi:MAG TPA: SDR family oxidoreductase [Candidatus Binatia bacterium]|jgi:NAD(P)-dependent dehydrogenase (short-subunit alcohol dehydrogenase family)|nr:SDR family oxidoreductase [Candidatus Binatia bacterium]
MPKRIVLITGVTRGLGRAMVDEFVRLGHTVLGCGRSRKEIEQLRRRLRPPHDFYVVDVASDDDVKSWASLLLSAHGPPDLLLNNAGIINKNAPLWEVPAREFAEVIDVNLKGTANVIRHFAPEMVKRKRGVIVNFSSGWGRSTDPEVAPYCASKWGIEGLTLALAQELPSGMAAVSLNPGVINTAMLQSCFGKSASGYMSAEEWAKTAVPFLLKLGPSDNGKQLELGDH